MTVKALTTRRVLCPVCRRVWGVDDDVVRMALLCCGDVHVVWARPELFCELPVWRELGLGEPSEESWRLYYRGHVSRICDHARIAEGPCGGYYCKSCGEQF